MLHTIYMLRSYTDPQWQSARPPAEDYLAFGFHLQGGHCWARHWIPPHMARRYAELGLSPSEAEEWGVIPALVEEYRAAGIHVLTVGEWVARGIMPSHARVLINSGAFLASSKGYLPVGARDHAMDPSEEDHGKWYDGFDRDDEDWPEPNEPYDPDERHYDPDDDRHPYSRYDPFDPDDLDDPFTWADLLDDLRGEPPFDCPSPWDAPVADAPDARKRSVSLSGSNVVPLFRSGRHEERSS